MRRKIVFKFTVICLQLLHDLSTTPMEKWECDVCERPRARALARDKMKNKNKSVSKNKSSKEFHGECRMCMCLHNHRKPYANE